MQKTKQFISDNWQLLFWPVVALLVFLPTFGTYTVLPSPDSAPFYPSTYKINRFVQLIEEAPSFSIGDILEFILPPLFRHDFGYWLAVVASALGGYWLMRERGAPKTAAALAGGAYAFAGYSFTLVSAGHRSYFSMMPYIPCTFAFLLHAMRRQDLLAYALAAATAAWTFRWGPDIGPQFLVVAALYALWLLATNAARRPLRERARHFLAGCAIAFAAFALVAAPSIYRTVTSTLTWRKQQIAESSGTALTASAPATEKPVEGAAKTTGEATKAREQWIFATNWSLPPEETIEFVAPGILGTWTGDRERPYWGRLGRSEGWDPARPGTGGFFNFRQHIVYLGSIPVALALFAVAAFVAARRRRGDASAEAAAGGDMPAYLSDAPFWAIVGLVALLLAFGRYAPFYRFFYAIPYMSYLRAPVKFMRLVEFATAILAGSGLAALMARDGSRRLRAGFAYAALAATAASVLYALHVNASADTFAAILGKLGARQLMRPMTQHAVHALWHAILGFGLVSVLAFALAKGKCRGQTAAAVLLVALAADIFIATRPFMFTVDKTLSYKQNIVTAAVREKVPPTEVPIIAVVGVQQLPEWFTESLSLNGIRRLPYTDVDNNAFIERSKGDIAAMCLENGARHLMIPATLSRAIDRRDLGHSFFFNIGQSGLTRVNAPTQNSFELLRVTHFRPYCTFHEVWAYADEPDWMAKVAEGRALVIGRDIPCPNTAEKDEAVRADITSRRYQNGRFFTEVETDFDKEGILLVLERMSSKFSLWVDGEPAEAIPAGYAHYMGVHLKPGHHTVKIGKPLPWRIPALAFATFLLVMAGVAVFARRAARNQE